MMGGGITVESRLNEGSQFVVALTFQRPSAEDAAAFGATHGPLPEEKRESPCDCSGIRILLAEDNAINAEIVMTLLKMHGAAVDWVQNGREALDAFEAAPESYAMILMDIQMPVMDGLEATRRIRALSRPGQRTVPIIALSANAFAEDIDAALKGGMNGYLSKPIEPGKLLEAVQRLL